MKWISVAPCLLLAASAGCASTAEAAAPPGGGASRATTAESFPDLLRCDQIDTQNAGVWVVDKTDPDADFGRIQPAIDVALPGDYILVMPGTYNENLRIVSKDITVLGCGGSAETFIDAGGRGTAVYLVGISRESLFQGFTLQNGLGGPAGFGGGLHMDGGFGILRDLQIVGNRSLTNGGGVFLRGATPDMKYVDILDNAAVGNGGGLYLTQAAAFMASMIISGNTAGADGGGIYTQVGVPVMQYVTVYDNEAINGGGMAGVDASPLIVSSSVSGNRASGSGGGIYARAETLASGPSLVNTELSDNSAVTRGGGLHAEGAIVLYEGGRVTGNSAAYGGGFYVDDTDVAILKNISALGNYAQYDGGGMVFSGGQRIALANMLLSANDADRYGGGAFFGGSAPFVSNAILAGNTAQAGGGIYTYVASPDLYNTTFAGNYAQGGFGGGMYVNESDAGSITNAVFASNRGGVGRENVYAVSSAMSTGYNAFYAGGASGVEGLLLSESDLVVGPGLIDGPGDGILTDDDYHLRQDSPLIDAGSLERKLRDPDGSPGDMGAYGGMYADQWDLDGDDYVQWWDPTLGLDPETHDCDDADATKNPESGCVTPPAE